MTRHFVRKPQILSVVALFVATITILFTLASLADVRAAGHASAEPSVAATQHALDIDLAKIDPSKKLLPLFLSAATYNPGGTSPNAVAVADVNGDGKPDLIVANCVPNGTGDCRTYGDNADGLVAVLLGNGDGTFQPPVTYDSGGADATAVVVADVNGDGKPDLVVANCGPSGSDSCANTPLDGVVTVLLGNGDGTFQPAVTYSSGGLSADYVAVADVNGDGKLDILVASYFDTYYNSTSGMVGVLLGNGDGTFQPTVAYHTGGIGATSVAVSDVNGDHKPDLLVANMSCQPNQGNSGCAAVMLGNGDGTFQAPVIYNPGPGETTALAVADVNGDGKPDLLVTNWCVFCLNTVGVLFGNGDGTFQPAVTYPTGGYGAWSITVADVNRDGNPDLLVANNCSKKDDLCTNPEGAIGVLLNNGDGTFQPAVAYHTGGDVAIQLTTADVNGDGKLDVLVVNQAEGKDSSVAVLLGYSPTSTTIASSLNPSTYGQKVTWTATVSNPGQTMRTGKVSFMWDKQSIGTATLNANGVATLTRSNVKVGTYPLTAVYRGDTTDAGSTSSILTQVVNPASTLTTPMFAPPTSTGTNSSTAALSSLAHPTEPERSNPQTQQPTCHSTTKVFVYGGPYVTETVTLDAALNMPQYCHGQYGYYFCDGTVTFYDRTAGTVLGTGNPVGNACSRELDTNSLTAGTHRIEAIYSGDPGYYGSHGYADAVVSPWPTTTTLISSPNPSSYGEAVTFTATPNGNEVAPTDKIRILDGATPVGTAMLNENGVAAVFTIKNLAVGSNTMTADYLGNLDSSKSTSPALNQVVNPASTVTGITSSANPSSAGETVTFTAGVSSSTGAEPTGTVTFTADGTALGTIALQGRIAKISIATLPNGENTITATYSGSTNFTGSTASLTQIVRE
ncbi:MAG TPA: Ig-like domain repeat protein [Terriglobales bacterium]|nr:Ig-like domain repeat protein [Terriglobales bacterium]